MTHLAHKSPKISALYEIALATEMRVAGAGPVDVYMGVWSVMSKLFLTPHKGYYIHDCVKMKYKAAYQPSYLLDAVCLVLYLHCSPHSRHRQQSHTFHPYKEAAEILDKHRWASFARG